MLVYDDLLYIGTYGNVGSRNAFGALDASGANRYEVPGILSISGQPYPAVYAMCEYHGQIIVSGQIPISSTTSAYVARFDGSQMHPITGPNGQVIPIAAVNGELIAGGSFTRAGGAVSPYLARWTDSTSPWLVSQPPAAVSSCGGNAVTLRIVAAQGYEGLNYQWRRNGVELSDEPGHIAGAASASLTIFPAKASDAGTYDCVISKECPGASSTASVLSVCPADFDCSGTLTIGDIFEYMNAWFAGDGRADLDGVVGLSVGDMFMFLSGWFEGC
jgi:hypothetical protein